MENSELYTIFFFEQQFNPRDLILYGHMNDLFRQKSHLGFQEEMFINLLWNNQFFFFGFCFVAIIVVDTGHQSMIFFLMMRCLISNLVHWPLHN